MRFLAFILIGLLTSCAPGGRGTVAGAPRPLDVEDRTVVQAAESLFAAMEARDTSALRNIFLADARLVIVQTGPNGEPRVVTRTAPEFIASVAGSGDRLVERMWEPRVETDGRVASLWEPYDFHVGGRFSHCGIDVFQFVRTADGWKISTLTYTLETTSCSSPPNPSAE